MATVRHAFDSAKDDPADTSVVGASKWDADHDLEDVASQTDLDAEVTARDFEFIKRRMGLVLTENGAVCDGTTDDTAAVLDSVGEVEASSTMNALYVPNLTKVTDTLVMEQGWIGKSLEGAGRNAGFLMNASNKPILKFVDSLTHSVKVTDLTLKYVTSQAAQTSSTAFGFDSASGYRYYSQFDVRNLWIVNAYNGLGNMGAGSPISFSNRFDGIRVNDAAHRALSFTAAQGAPNNQFGHVYIDNQTVTPDDIAVYMQGQEAVIRELVVEGWRNTVLQVVGSDPETFVQQLHIEACLLATSASFFVNVSNGPLRIGSAVIGGTVADGINVRLFDVQSGGRLTVDQLDVAMTPPGGGGHIGVVEANAAAGNTANIGWVEAATGVVPWGNYTGLDSYDGSGKTKSGAGVTNLADADFGRTPPDGTRGLAHNTTDGKSYSCLRANGTWKSVEVTA